MGAQALLTRVSSCWLRMAEEVIAGAKDYAEKGGVVGVFEVGSFAVKQGFMEAS